MNTHELVEAASHIAGGMAAAVFAQPKAGAQSLTPVMVETIARTSVELARKIEEHARRSP